ncbi:saccharopine dehydrogenase family protein [Bacillus sp. FJAT-42315]|uniref:saccharopine dehydrogenase family protein n=1 Tax=Bacillus sp. FJAT-42315 TaxID=2014077 RepID=UPI000C250CBC|nr:saccharopine dehydrogenase NADP-binding domain-containing protein [Bacillus sp. FJAT-42315]
MKKDIVVVGGYGHVGGQICKMLGEVYPGRVYAAGRRLEQAERFCQTMNGKVKPQQLTTDESVDWQWLERTKLVIMCIDQESPTFARKCLMNGTHYVDISAKGSFLSQLEKLNAESCEATGVLSVGLAPGLTNLLAQQAKLVFDQTDRIDIAIMLGLGDSHGKAAIEWTIDQVNSGFEVMQNNQLVAVDSFTDRQLTDFGSSLGKHVAYRFPFSDQQTLPRTLHVPTVATRLCFDSHWMTASMALLRRMGVSRFLEKKAVRSSMVKLLSSLRIGTAQYAVKVDAYGFKEGEKKRVGLSLHGENESLITAQVAAAVGSSLYSSHLPTGVYHLDQLYELTNQANTLYLQRKGTNDQFFISRSCAVNYGTYNDV